MMRRNLMNTLTRTAPTLYSVCVRRNLASLLGCLLLIISTFVPALAGNPEASPNRFARGGQFKDLVLPMPIHDGLESEGIWGAESVLPRDIHNGVEDSQWCYWGGNPIQGKDGNYHIAICRWKEEASHMGWHRSEVAHCVSDQPTGPYSVTKTIVEKGHNPEIIQLADGRYVLHVNGGRLYTADAVAGPWIAQGKMTIDTRGHRVSSGLSNLTGVEREDGSLLFLTKRGDIMISNTGLLGPYKTVSAHNYTRYSGYPEDPVIWKSRHQYHAIYNHAIDRKSRYMRSLDGIHWRHEVGQPYDADIFRYTDGTENTWYKFERPKVLQDELGRATHLSLAVIDVAKDKDLGNDRHSSKNVIMPLVTEKLVTILNEEPINETTNRAELRIKAEPGFSPIEQVDLSSLRLGSANTVNCRGGARAVTSAPKGQDLIVSFSTVGLGLSADDYDLKLLGQTQSGDILFGYALLPGKTDDPPALVTLPIHFNEDRTVLLSAVENYGLKESKPCQVRIYELSEQGRTMLKQYQVPALQPYGVLALECPLRTKASDHQRYEAVIAEPGRELALWEKVDDAHSSVVFSGDWIKTTIEGKNLHLGSQRSTEQKGASVTFTFTGTQARCYGSISKQKGNANVYVDGVLMEQISSYFGTEIHNTVIYQTEELPEGQHTLKLVATGEHCKGWPNVPLVVDAFSYKPPAASKSHLPP